MGLALEKDFDCRGAQAAPATAIFLTLVLIYRARPAQIFLAGCTGREQVVRNPLLHADVSDRGQRDEAHDDGLRGQKRTD